MDSKGIVYHPEAVAKILEAAKRGDEEALKKASELVEIDDETVKALPGMNRAQRRAWYSNQRRKNPRFGGAQGAK